MFAPIDTMIQEHSLVQVVIRRVLDVLMDFRTGAPLAIQLPSELFLLVLVSVILDIMRPQALFSNVHHAYTHA